MDTGLEKVVQAQFASSPTWLASRGQQYPTPAVRNRKRNKEQTLLLSVVLCSNVEQGSLTEHGAWSMKNTLASKLTSLPVRHSDRLVSFHTILQGCKFPTTISVYAPTFMADPTCDEAL